jgi:hypothetical protein
VFMPAPKVGLDLNIHSSYKESRKKAPMQIREVHA